MKNIFTVIGGSVTGTEHIKKGKNNQDAMLYYSDEHITIGCISDGCSASNKESSLFKSEVGANLLVHIAIKEIRLFTCYGEDAFEQPNAWSILSQRITNTLYSIAQLASTQPYEWLDKHCSATLLCCISTAKKTYFIGCGDGMYGYNNTLQTIPSVTKNLPPYLVYNLIPSNDFPLGSQDIQLTLYESVPTQTIKTCFLGTDGVIDLCDAATKKLPGQEVLLGAINQFWDEDVYWRNPYMLQNKLTLINTPKTLRDSENGWKVYPGLLKDDTTLLILKNTSIGNDYFATDNQSNVKTTLVKDRKQLYIDSLQHWLRKYIVNPMMSHIATIFTNKHKQKYVSNT